MISEQNIWLRESTNIHCQSGRKLPNEVHGRFDVYSAHVIDPNYQGNTRCVIHPQKLVDR